MKYNAQKQDLGYHAHRRGGLWINFDNLVVFNVRVTPHTLEFSFFASIRKAATTAGIDPQSFGSVADPAVTVLFSPFGWSFFLSSGGASLACNHFLSRLF